MTRKHFEAIAAALQEARNCCTGCPSETAGVDIAIREITKACASFNGRFDNDRFERACGLEG